ncbi:protein tesmin/TSO1-like CXC 7 [Ananas comosus]|uniref:Protein tesmin/TSO1-like CXC 7 n=1 Tax=Ananas comosus TaxID=4615 RepID=A0A6P5FB07_ANACO|nr:protein tesmin/TSO1-like CXC 7 [Ananas comosus]
MATEDTSASENPPIDPPLSPPSTSDPEEPRIDPAPGDEKDAKDADGRDSSSQATADVLSVEVGLDQGKREAPEDGGEGNGCRRCSCKKSRCLKLYCACFAGGTYCSESCGCQLCFNNPTYGETVHSTRKDIWLRKGCSFPLKANETSEAASGSKKDTSKSPSSSQRKKGCNCKKTSCLKKYCDCFQGGIGCSLLCKCEDCQNIFGRKVGGFLEGQRNLPSIGWNDDDYSDDEEDDYTIAARSPFHQSPFSRESSFHQANPDVKADMMNGQIYWQLSPLKAQPWHRVKRPNEDSVADISHKRHLKNEDKYTISRCIEVMSGIAELSQEEKSLAPDVFVDPHNREIFLSLSGDVRSMWLRRKLEQLS